MNKTYILNGLDCAHCAEKIENTLLTTQGIRAVKLNFITKKLYVEAENEKNFEEVKKVVLSIEPDVVVSEEETQENGERAKVIRIIISAFLFISGFFIKELFILAYLISGYDILIKAAKNILKGRIFDENFLMSIATIGAALIGEIPEAAAVMLFYQTGELFQSMAVRKSRRSVKALTALTPEYAFVEENGEIIRKKPYQVKTGDILVVKPGERVSLDGKITEGSGEIDTSAITGESMPVYAQKNSFVRSGSINLTALLKIEVTAPFEESTVSRITEMVLSATENKSEKEKFITTLSRYYTPIVVIAALLLAVAGSAITGDVSRWVYRALQFLVISCPCALVISVPLSFFSGIGKAAKEGILVKGSGCLEKAAGIETVAFDKTGTLTKGEFSVIDILPANGTKKEELLSLAASCEAMSNHPVAKAITKSYQGELYEINDFTEIAGKGAVCSISGKKLYVGSLKLMQEIGVSCRETENTSVFVAVEGEFAGSIILSDTVKEESLGIAKKLKKIGVKKVALLTGDNKQSAEPVIKATEADESYFSLMPADKAELCQTLKKDGAVMFVGDGINDAPVIATADIGVAMGTSGSDIAIETADIVFVGDDPQKAVRLIEISKKTLMRVYENIYFALGIKLIILLLGAMGITTMWAAVFADVGVSVLAIINAIRK